MMFIKIPAVSYWRRCPSCLRNSFVSGRRELWNHYSRIPASKKWLSLGKIGGGVAVYFKDSLDCISIAKYDNCDIEATWLELKVKSQRLLVGCIYRPPDSEGFYDKFLPILERISANRKNVIITGDFNSNMLDNSGNGQKFKDVLQLVNFKNVIKNPTRVTEHSSTINMPMHKQHAED